MSLILLCIQSVCNEHVYIPNKHAHCFASKSNVIFSCCICICKMDGKHNFMFNTFLQDFPHQGFTGLRMAPHSKPPAELYCRPSEISTVLSFWMLSARTPENTQHILAI